MRLLTLLTITFLIIFGHDSNAQRWKKYRHEIQGGVGATSFLGELGGGEGPGKDLFLDFDGKSSRYLITGGYRYKLAEFASARANITYARLSGNDAFAGDVHRQSRNLSFRTALIELTAVGEVYFIREKLSSRYKVRGIKGALGSSLSAYLFGGVGGFFFNPRGKFVGNSTYPGDDKWYSLQPLGTEGQGQAGKPKKYSRINMCIPVGVGAKFNLTPTMAISLEYGFRYTFTDYLDDVSTVYADQPSVQAANGGNGNAAAYFANPSVVVMDGETRIYKGSPGFVGQQRGNANSNDTYMFAILALNYKFVSKKTNRPKF
ncbi:MAG: hypothetical protein KC456_11045 [Flavobacteriales bacterium]|jgi:hypothetical protein|nr:hypothetical protein [Flavobacteriales bacterium]